MTDQATVLRGMMERRSSPAQPSCLSPAGSPGLKPGGRGVRTIAVTSGKGGVGKSLVALNLAIALAEMQQRVCLLDANLGLGNIDLLCGLNGYWNLSHVMTGARRLQQVVLAGPAGVDIVPGASGLSNMADCTPEAQRDLLTQLTELEQSHDWLILDTGTGIHQSIRRFVSAADIALVLATPEPTAIANAYAALKSLAGADSVELRVLVNQAESAAQASRIAERLQQTSRLFLHCGIDQTCSLPHDPAVSRSVFSQRAVLLETPDSPFAAAIRQLAEELHGEPAIARRRTPYFSRLLETRQFSPAGLTAVTS